MSAKPRVLVFTDSRGQFRNAPDTRLFWEKLAETHDVTSYIQPYKWTTILDFIALVRNGAICPQDFDHVVLWAGVVDFSPRPEPSCRQDLLDGAGNNLVAVQPGRVDFYSRTVNSKADDVRRLLENRGSGVRIGDAELSAHLCRRWDVAYENDWTASLYDERLLEPIAEELNAIGNLVFIDTCAIHPEWDGNFGKGRPRNINRIVEYSRRLSARLTCPIVEVSTWSDADLMEMTVDSIHLTQSGSDFVLDGLKDAMAERGQGTRPRGRNFVLTATDEVFFPTTLHLVETIFDNSGPSVDGIVVFDIGMTPGQRAVFENIRRVHVVDYLPEDLPGLKGLPFDFFQKSTYGFKSYLTVRARAVIERITGTAEDLNVLYIDGGISVNRSLAPIFEIVEEEGIFCVDHDDCHDLYGSSPLCLFHILTPKLFDQPGFDFLSHEKMCGPYIKAGFFGYRPDGPYQFLIDEYWHLCRSTEVLTQPKPPQSNAEMRWYQDTTTLPHYMADTFGADLPDKAFKYVNARQDQSALSYVVAKHDAPIHNSRAYTFTVSSGHSRPKWDDIFERLKSLYPEIETGAQTFWQERNEAPRRRTAANLLPAPGIVRDSLTTLHRGAMVEEDRQKYAGQLLNRARNVNNDVFILLGNGPSLGEVDLHGLKDHSTMGLNAAYRAYRCMDFWPTYFGCFDALVCGNHAGEFKSLIRDSEISKFFFIDYDEKKQPIFPEQDIRDSAKFTNLSFVERTIAEKERSDILSVSFSPFYDMLTSGTNSIQVALLLGYRKIILLGCDANYTEVIDGAKQESGNRHHIFMEKTPETNTNYWFDDYQQEGDRFNLPNLAGCQLPAWNRLFSTVRHLNVNAEIINCSPISQIDAFKKMPLQDALAYYASYDVHAPGSGARLSRGEGGKRETAASVPVPVPGTPVSSGSRNRDDLMDLTSRILLGWEDDPRIDDLLASAERMAAGCDRSDPAVGHFHEVRDLVKRRKTG